MTTPPNPANDETNKAVEAAFNALDQAVLRMWAKIEDLRGASEIDALREVFQHVYDYCDTQASGIGGLIGDDEE